MAKKKVNNKNIRVVNDDTLAKPNQDLSLLDKKVKKVKHDIKDEDILTVKNLKMYFPINVGLFKTKNLKAVDDVSFTIKRGETLGLVGESGCGKTTLGRTILHLYDPTSGLITFNDHPVITKKDLKNFRRKATVVFQDPYSSLNPRMTVADIIGEPIDVHNVCEDIVKERHFGKFTQLEKDLESLKALNLEHSHEEKKLEEAISKKQAECDTLAKTCDKDFIVAQIAGEKNQAINDHISTLWREYEELIESSKDGISSDKKRIQEIKIEIKSKEKECDKLKKLCEGSSVVKSIIKEKKEEHRIEVYNAQLELEKFKNNFIDHNPNADVYQSEYKKKQEDYRKLKQLDVVKEIESKMADKISRRKKARIEAYENALKELKNLKESLASAIKNLETSETKFKNDIESKHELCLKEEKTPKVTNEDVENKEKAEVTRRLKEAEEAKKQADKQLNALNSQLSSLQEKNKAKIASLEKELEKRTAEHDKAKAKEKVSYDDIKNKFAKEVEKREADSKVKIDAAIKELADYKAKIKKDKTLKTEYRYKKRALELLKEKSSTNNIIKSLYNEKNADIINEEREYNAFVRAYHFALDNECYDIKSLIEYELKLDEYQRAKEETKIPYFLLKFEAKEERKKRILQLMSDVGLSPEQSTRYAHSFSGGQRQRIGIARALASNPEFIVCDEPVSALDVSIQAQILNTFQELQKKLGLTYLFVAHNLLVVKHISDRIAVMYLGHIVELCDSEELYKHPLHPYTVSLLSAIPEPDPKRARANKRQILEGEIPSPLHVPSGCPFRLRCPRATDQCTETRPELIEVKKGHFTACHLVKPTNKNKK